MTRWKWQQVNKGLRANEDARELMQNFNWVRIDLLTSAPARLGKGGILFKRRCDKQRLREKETFMS